MDLLAYKTPIIGLKNVIEQKNDADMTSLNYIKFILTGGI